MLCLVDQVERGFVERIELVLEIFVVAERFRILNLDLTPCSMILPTKSQAKPSRG
jgi:hypothetical protein